jgi:C-terminal processing protease CtpA/Prc
MDLASNADHPTSGFRINYNFSTYQQQEIEIIFVTDHKRFGQLNKGDILLQINGINVDSISEKDLNKFIMNSSNTKSPNEFKINYLTVYRPFVEDQLNQNNTNGEDEDDGSSQQDNENQNDDKDEEYQGDNNNDQNNENQENNSNSTSNSNNKTNNNLNLSYKTKPINNHKTVNGTTNGEASKPINVVSPISSSTPMRNSLVNSNESANEIKNKTNMLDLNTLYDTPYEIEDILLNKINGAMGLSIVGGGNVACHPFGVEKPGIFISKIVPDGAASKTNLKVGDRILKVNNVDVTHMSHDDTVEELKRNVTHVSLLVSHDPQPSGLQEIMLHRSYPEETLGIRINGGIENKSANIFDPNDEGIFVVNIINGTIAQKDGRLQIGTRIMEVSILILFPAF